MTEPSNPIQVVKLRTSRPLPGNFSNGDWQELCNSLGYTLQGGDIRRIKYPLGLSRSIYTGFIFQLLQGTKSNVTLVLDVCFDKDDASLSTILDCLSSAIRQCLVSEIVGPKAVVILTSAQSLVGSDIVQIMADGANTNNGSTATSFVMVDGNGTVYGDRDCFPVDGLWENVGERIRSDNPSYRLRRLQVNIIRERGVYTHKQSDATGEMYFRYRYFFSKEGIDLLKDHVVDLLLNYIEEHRQNQKDGRTDNNPPISHLIIDASSAPWMESVSISLQQLEVISSNGIVLMDVGANSKDIISDYCKNSSDSPRIAILTGVSRRGSTVTRIRDYFGFDENDVVLSASVLADCRAMLSHQVGESGTSTQYEIDADNQHCWRRIPVGGTDWYYLVNVPVEQIDSDAWEVRAAKRLNEVVDLGANEFKLSGEVDVKTGSASYLVRRSRVGLLHFLATLGSACEVTCSARPTRDNARVVRYFPKMDDIDGTQRDRSANALENELMFFDANWLGALALQDIRQRIGSGVGDKYVILVPADVKAYSRGIDHIAYAVARTHDVRVVRMDVSGRGSDSVFPVDNDDSLIRTWQREKFVLLDETVVTGETMRVMESELRSALESPRIELKYSIFDLCGWSAQGADRRAALYSWRYLGYVADSSSVGGESLGQ